jgi:hypothetical protein
VSAFPLADLRLAIRTAFQANEGNTRHLTTAATAAIAARNQSTFLAGTIFASLQERQEAEQKAVDLEARVEELRQTSDEGSEALDQARAAYDAAVRQTEPLWPDTPDIPLLLLPVRLETIYVNTDEGLELWIRIYPDEVHVDAHEPELTREERAARDRYQREIAAAGDDENERDAAWRTLLAQLGISRATWVLETLRRDEPVGDREDTWTRAARSGLLPDRFEVSAYNGDELAWRVTGEKIPETLALGFTPPKIDPAPRKDDLPWDAASRWLVDFDEALKAGMAVKVHLDEAESFELITAVGVRGGDDPTTGSERWDEALRAHQYTHGLAVLPPDTPTNNTPATRSGWRSRPEPRPPAVVEEQLDRYDPTSDQAAAVAARAFGIAGEPALASAPDALTDDEALVKNLHNAVGTFAGLSDAWLPPLSGDPGASAAEFPDVEFVVKHFEEHVRGRGPLPTLRIGRQPYGVLPVCARDLLRPMGADGDVPELIGLIAHAFGQGFLDLSVRVPRLGEGDDQDAVLLDILSRRAYSTRLQTFEQSRDLISLRSPGPPLAIGWFDPKAIVLPWLQDPFVQFTDPADLKRHSRTMSVVANPSQEFLDFFARRPLHAYDKLAEDLRAILEQLPPGQEDSPEGQANITAKKALDAAFKPLVDAAHAGVFLPFGGPTVVWKWWWTMCVVPIERAPEDQLNDTARAIMQLAATNLVSEKQMLTFEDLIFEGNGDDDHRTPAQRLDEIERRLMETLDCLSHRVDAWITSIAQVRLAAIRKQRSEGLAFGAYGWVTDVHKRDDEPVSDGYLLTPSLHHATTAAVLRAGFRAHEHPSALAVDLQSWRTRAALKIVDGVRTGQPLAALLGYQFERGLHEAGVGKLDELIDRFRRAFPLTPAVEPGSDGSDAAQASMGARNVVDGLALRAALGQGHPALQGLGDAESAVLMLIRELGEAVDAVADLLLAESVHHLVGGNPLRAGLAADAIGRGDVLPEEFDVIRTPRGAAAVTHAVGLLYPERGAADGWSDERPLATLEPGLERWCRARLGPAGGWSFAIADTDRHVTLADLDLSALDVVTAALPAEGHSPIVRALEEHAAAELGEDGIGRANELVLVCGQLRAALATAAPLLATHLDPRRPDGLEGADLEELARRAGPWHQQVADARDDLRKGMEALSRGDDADAAVEGAVAKLARLGIVAAAPAGAPAAMRAARLQSRLEGVGLDPLDPPPAAGKRTAVEARSWLSAATAAVTALVGDHLKLAPRIDAVLPPAPAGLDADTVDDWLRTVRSVRPAVAVLDDALVAAEVIAAGAPSGFVVSQAGDETATGWVATTHPDEQHPARASLVLQHDGDPPEGKLSGLVVDAWAEAIPRPGDRNGPEETAGITFHFDGPGACAPQALLLAVPPDPARGWHFEDVHGVVEDTFGLARLRGLDLGDGPELRSLLPFPLAQVTNLAFS